MVDRLSGMSEGLHKARSGLIRALVRIENCKISDIIISGDYIMTPEHYADEMENELINSSTDKDVILSKLKNFFQKNKFQCPETHPEDFATAIMKAIEAGGTK